MNRVVKSTLLTLVLFAPASVLAQTDVSVYVTGPDLQTKELELKVVEGQSVKNGFQVKPESVVQVSQDGNLLVVTEPRNNVDSVKVTDGGGKITVLVNTNGDTFSLLGITPGVYTLDAIVNMPNSDDRAAYETILVILSSGQSPQDPTQVIQTVKIVTDVRVTFEEDDDGDECSDRPGSAGLKFPQDDLTECDQRDYDECRKQGFESARCDNIYELFWDDDCFGFNSADECDSYFNDKDAFCLANPDHKKCPKPDPLPPCKTQGDVPGQKCIEPITPLPEPPVGDCMGEDGRVVSCEDETVPPGAICPPTCPNDEDLPPTDMPTLDDERIVRNPVEPEDPEGSGDGSREFDDSEETEEESSEGSDGTDSGVN